MSRFKKLTTIAAVAALALGLAACGGGDDDTAMEPAPPPAPDLGPAMMAAATAATAAATAASDADAAATAAESAATAAEAAVTAQDVNQAADAASYAVAQNAAMRARAAATAARAAATAAMSASTAAGEAKDAADAAETLAAAEAARDNAVAQQAIAEAAGGNAGTGQTDAETEQANAVMYANMVMAAQVEADALSAAMTAADTAAGAAEDAADAAEAAAAKVAELTGADSQQAMDANDAATAARAAADAARSASDSAQGADNSGDAEMYQGTAETEQGKAETQQANAEELRREAQVASDASGLQNEARDLADAQEATQDAADSVAAHLTAVQGKAADARAQANAARAAANRAKSAMRDYANADKYAMMAEAEATAAEAALMRAEDADTDAQAALTAANAAATSADAEAEQAKAEAADVIAAEAHTGTTGAGMAYMRAEAAAMKAAEYSGMNVLALLAFANADSVSDTVAREHAIDNVAIAIAAARGTTDPDDGDNDGSTTDGTGGTTATVTWRGNTVDDPSTDLVDESATGRFEIIVNGITGDAAEDALPFNLTAKAGTPPEPKTATRLTHGLPGFSNAYEISSDGIHAIVFTDKVQGKNSTLATRVNFSNTPVTSFGRIVPANQSFTVVDGETTDTRNTATSVDATSVTTLNASAAYDHDGNPATPALDVTFACVPAAECTALQTEGGRVVGVVGDGTLTVSFNALVGAAAATDNPDYLAFGIWVNEAGGTDNDTIQVAAFADGGQPAGAAGVPAALAGTATYRGAAAGLYTAGDSVDYFHASATLTAKFGTPGTVGDDAQNPTAGDPTLPDGEAGTVSGVINNIVAGGNAMSDVITLNSGAIDAGTFGGTARMGPAKVVDTVASYTYNGTWEGAFYGPGTDDRATATVEGPATVAPKAAAGTFGVSGTDNMGTPTVPSDDITRSYVGAFGARR